MTKICWLFRITGRVQGVGYRVWFEREAAARGLSGWVRNRSDGSVEALVCGVPEALAEIQALARRGPPAALVQAVESAAAQESPPDTGFRCLPTV